MQSLFSTTTTDTVDAILYRETGSTIGIEHVLSDNPHLVYLPLQLPIGTLINITATSYPTQPATLQLWD